MDGMSICSENNIITPNMEDIIPGRICNRRAGNVTYLHHFRVELYSHVIDHLGQEMANRFSEACTELIMCISCLDPKNNFSNFSASRLLRLAELYPHDFSLSDRLELKEELKMWVSEMRENEIFFKLQNIGDLTKKMIEVKFHTIFPSVYLLIQLALVLSVATATVERVFSAMNVIKSDLCNKMGDVFLTDCLVCYIEKDVFMSIENEVIIQYFQNMATRRLDLLHLRVGPLLQIALVPSVIV